MCSIAIFVDLQLLHRFQKISDNRVKFFNHLTTHHPEIKLISQLTQSPDVEDILQANGINPAIVIHYIMGPGAGDVNSQIMVRRINQSPRFHLLWLEDLQHTDQILPLIKKHQIKGLLMSVRQKKIVKKYLEADPRLVIGSLDHYIDDQVWKEYGLPKQYDMIFYGYVDKQYPFRQRLLKLFLEMSRKDPHFRFKWIKHPGYWNLEKRKASEMVVGKDLARVLNSSYLAVCTKSKHDMLVKKYLEAGFCHCGIVGDIPTDYRQHFEGKIIEIKESMSDAEIRSKVMNALKNKDVIMNRARHLADYLKCRFNYRSGGQYLVNITTKMLEIYLKRQKGVVKPKYEKIIE